MGSTKYSVGDKIKLTTDADARTGTVLAVGGVLIEVGWVGGGTSKFSARVLERLTSEPECEDQGPHRGGKKRRSLGQIWRDPMGRDHAV